MIDVLRVPASMTRLLVAVALVFATLGLSYAVQSAPAEAATTYYSYPCNFSKTTSTSLVRSTVTNGSPDSCTWVQARVLSKYCGTCSSFYTYGGQVSGVSIADSPAGIYLAGNAKANDDGITYGWV